MSKKKAKETYIGRVVPNANGARIRPAHKKHIGRRVLIKVLEDE